MTRQVEQHVRPAGSPARAPRWSPRRIRDLRNDVPIIVIMLIGLFIALIPILMMVNISMKTPGQFLTNPLGVTVPFSVGNYEVAFHVMWRSILNTIGMSIFVVVGSLLVSACAGFAFARFDFPGREALFWCYLSVLFIPEILTFPIRFTLVEAMGILDTYWVQVLPYMATAQIFQTVVLRAFFAGLPNEVFEAARVDGAGIWTQLWRVAIPMSRPILATLAVLRAVGFWDEWVWPLVTVTSYEVRPVGLQVFFLQSDVGGNVGQQMAGFIIASIPVIVLFIVATKQFVEGLTSGAIKF